MAHEEALSNLEKPSQQSIFLKWANSKANYKFGRVINISLILFFLTRPMFIKNHGHSLVTLGLTCVAGVLFWTFAEYLFHRWAYHNNSSLFAQGHEAHHDAPEALVGMPWAVSTPILLLAYGLSAAVFPVAATGVFFAGFWAGYYAYTLVHHAIHHWDFNSKWFRAIKRHHKVHHKMPDKNLGVTTIFWDRVFRTKV